jgi:L-lactate dehydrogenase
VIKLKGGAGFAVGLSIRDVVHSIALDQKRIMPVSTLISGPYGIRDVCLSVPTVVGRKGAEAQLEVELWPKELSALQHSGQVLRETIEAVYKSNPKAADGGTIKAGGGSIPAAAKNGSAGSPVRVTMGAGGGKGDVKSSRVTISGQWQGKS